MSVAENPGTRLKIGEGNSSQTRLPGDSPWLSFAIGMLVRLTLTETGNLPFANLSQGDSISVSNPRGGT